MGGIASTVLIATSLAPGCYKGIARFDSKHGTIFAKRNPERSLKERNQNRVLVLSMGTQGLGSAISFAIFSTAVFSP